MNVEEYMQSTEAMKRIKAVAKDMRDERGFSYRKSRKEAPLDVRRFAEALAGAGKLFCGPPTRKQMLWDERLQLSQKETLTEEDKHRLRELNEKINKEAL